MQILEKANDDYCLMSLQSNQLPGTYVVCGYCGYGGLGVGKLEYNFVARGCGTDFLIANLDKMLLFFPPFLH